MNKLDEILAQKRLEVARRKADLSLAQLQERITPRSDKRSFHKALRRNNEVALIAEIKRASPSAGVIRHDFKPTEIARAYERGGAHALSILTDEKFFQGKLKFLPQARAAVSLPCLRKDFMVAPYQIWEARLAEADAILLIVAALKKQELMDFMKVAEEADLEVLVEIHDERELEVALEIQAPIIGINNRNLKTFQVDLAVTEKLTPKIPKTCTVVSESGILAPSDLQRVLACGAHAVLVGESLMRQTDITEAVKTLLKKSS